MDAENKYALAVKPVLWSTNNYSGPCFPKVVGGFPSVHGYGGEEWNNHNDRIFEGKRIFHTETKDKLNSYAEHGHLGLIMTAMTNDTQFIVGVACGVRRIQGAGQSRIAEQFNLQAAANDVWKFDGVKRKYQNRLDFDQHWGDGTHIITWECPTHLYHWFEKPIVLPKYPLNSEKSVLAKMHNSYQALRPEDGLRLLNDYLPNDGAIKEWLLANEFDESFISSKERRRTKPMNSKERRATYSSAAAIDPYERYLAERIIKVDPRHGKMELRFRKYLESNGGSDFNSNSRGIDLIYNDNQIGVCIAELKPVRNEQTKYALREAIGQVLEYGHYLEPAATPLIVIDKMPDMDQVNFINSLGIGLAWEKGNNFEFSWPKT